jgi:hypothetical protein
MFNSSFVLPAEVSRWWNAVAAVAAPVRDRPTLAGVHVEMGHVWSPIIGDVDGISLTATDSYRLLNVVIPAPCGNVEHYVDGIDGPVYFAPGAITLPASIKVGARSMLRVEWYSSDITDAYSRSYKIGPEVKVSTKGGTSVVEAITADFPNWRNLMPVEDRVGETEPFAVDPTRLGTMLAAIGKASGDDARARFVSTSATKAVRVDLVVGDTPRERTVFVSGIIMPMRTPEGVTAHVAGRKAVTA